MRIAFFEDSGADGFAPVALTRPVFDLVCGQFSLRERLCRMLKASDWGAFIRPLLVESFREACPEAAVNDPDWLTDAPTLLINSRWLPSREAFDQLTAADQSIAGFVGDTLVFLWVDPFETPLISDTDWSDPLLKIAGTRHREETTGHVLLRPWNLIELNSELLLLDFALFARRDLASSQRFFTLTGEAGAGTDRRSLNPQVAVQGNPELVFIHPLADIDPFVVIDARSGPVSIDAGARVQAFTRIEGPCHIGAGSQLFRANVKAGTTIGPVCRIGGEIEASIIHGYANKYHDGFLGHSYLCPWTNLGALTTNSDLKNDYSNVSVPLRGEAIASGSKKVGAFIGDHTRTALCSLFNTGSSIGVMTMILPGGELLPKYIPSFSRLWHGVIDDGLHLETAIETSRRAMDRRDCELTGPQERLLRTLHRMTARERQTAIERQTRRGAGSSAGALQG